MKTYILPKTFRKNLKEIWGTPFFGSKKEILKNFNNFCRKNKFKKIITVGDYCSINLPSDIKIFDGKIKRKKIKKIPQFSLSSENPPGTIQKTIWPIVKKALKNNENLFVKGEEDLLVIPVVLLSENKTAVVYGFPNKGICVIKVSLAIKKNFKDLLNQFKTK